MIYRLGCVWLLLACFAKMACCVAEEQQVSLPPSDPYCPKQEVLGEIQIVGSTTMQQLGALWADGFKQIHPQVQVKIDCRGSETAPLKLAKNQKAIGLMSRPLDESQRGKLEQKLGCRVMTLTVCHDAVGVVVHRTNPLDSLNWVPETGLLPAAGDPSVAITWGDLGNGGDWSGLPIALHGPNSQSGTRKYLDRVLLGDDSRRAKITEHVSRTDLVAAVAADRGALGLVSLSRGMLENVRLVPIARGDQAYVQPTEAEIAARRYPLIRSLFLVVPVSGDSLRDPLLKEFVAYILSRCGQQDVVKDGFLPLSRSEIHVQEDLLGWSHLQ